MIENYLKERENLQIVKSDKGFILFKLFEDKTALISDYYTKPEFRKNGEGYKLADIVFSICKERGIERVFCQSDISANGHRVAALSILNYGFDIVRLEGNLIIYSMEVSKWAKR